MIWVMIIAIVILYIIITRLARYSRWGIIFHEKVFTICIFAEIGMLVILLLCLMPLEISGYSPTISEKEISSSTYDVLSFSPDLVTDGKYRFTVDGEKYEISESNELIVEIDSDSPSKVKISEVEKISLFSFIPREVKSYSFY